MDNMAYQPNKAIHPGYLVARAIKKEGLTQKNICERTGLSEKHLSQIINGEASITVETALLFENALGGTASFWNNLEKNYQETKARVERESLVVKELELLSGYPYKELSDSGYVEPTRNRKERVINLWKFFAVNSLKNVPQMYPTVNFRKRAVKNKSAYIASWLRCGEIKAKDILVGAFSETRLKKVLPTLRSLTLKEPEVFSDEVKKILAKSGIALVYIPHFEGTGVSGAVRWVGHKPVIQLSLHGKCADKFWFNLFHEIGHLLHHGKKKGFIEYVENSSCSDEEQEADNFAANKLIPPKKYQTFLERDDFSEKSIREFAEKIGVHTGIVIGRLQHDDKISWRTHGHLQSRLEFAQKS